MPKFIALITATLAPLFTKVGYKVFKAALQAAEKYVLEADQQRHEGDGVFTTDEKRQWVVDQLRALDLGTGNVLADSVINLLIELAVQRVKGKK